jgi:hypothetical protein
MTAVTPREVVQEAIDLLTRREIALSAEIDMYMRTIQRLQAAVATLALRADRVGVEERNRKERELGRIKTRLTEIEEDLARSQAAYEALVAVEKSSRDPQWRPGPSAVLAEGLRQLRSALERTATEDHRVGAFPKAGSRMQARAKEILSVLDRWGFKNEADRRSIRP